MRNTNWCSLEPLGHLALKMLSVLLHYRTVTYCQRDTKISIREAAVWACIPVFIVSEDKDTCWDTRAATQSSCKCLFSCFNQKRTRQSARGQTLWSSLDWAVTSNNKEKLERTESHFWELWILMKISSATYGEAAREKGKGRSSTYWTYTVCQYKRETKEDKTNYSGHLGGGGGAGWVLIRDLEDTTEDPHTYLEMYLSIYPYLYLLSTYPSIHSATV